VNLCVQETLTQQKKTNFCKFEVFNSSPVSVENKMNDPPDDPGGTSGMQWDWTAPSSQIESDLQRKVADNQQFRSSLQGERGKKDSHQRRNFRKPNEVWNFERSDVLTGKFVRIKSCIDGELEKINPIVMEKWLENNVPDFSNCRRTKDGELILLTKNEKQTEKFLKMTRIQTEPNKFVDLKIELIDSMNRSKGTVFGSDILRIPDEGEFGLKQCFLKQGIVEYVSLPSKNKDGIFGHHGLYVLTFDQRQPMEEVKVGFLRYTVKPWIPSPLKCQHCLEFGHTKNRCKNQDDLCRGCNKTKHEGECTTAKCHHCLPPKDQHQTFSPVCPVMKKEKKICEIKTNRNISFAQARALVEKESEMNFAAALRTGNEMNEQKLEDLNKQSSEAEKVLDQLQQKVKKLQEQQKMIILYKQKISKLEAENSAMSQEAGLDENQLLELSSDDEEELPVASYLDRQLRNRSSQSVAPAKPTVPAVQSTVQKRNAEVTKIKSDKKPKNSDLNSPSMQVPKKLTAEIIAKFDVETMKQYNYFKTKNPSVDPYYVRGQDGGISIGAPVFQKQ
jgi:hypothetical protein